jgi:hypothetical protein
MKYKLYHGGRVTVKGANAGFEKKSESAKWTRILQPFMIYYGTHEICSEKVFNEL